ncbi:MAG: hypothetical protein ACXVAY_02735 [Mucilaginibacter sp.]
MQKITVESITEFIISHDIPYAPTQTKLCIPIISRMCQKMSHGIKFDKIKVFDNIIIDGHHRYLSALIMNFELGQVPTNSTSATEPISWNLVEFVEDDWDTPAKIDYLNELDAKYNELELEFVKRITLR